MQKGKEKVDKDRGELLINQILNVLVSGSRGLRL